ncbi:hypothetical protein [Methylocystis silviterrae]|uniref:hypothetical protein n=1 Tax=Methylocystis silviterrae TaxID=2743612 RepID=UPI001E56694A|nr:hypothetical protein [Methylocystis silviterrae]
MKNITVSLDDELYRRARIRAAQDDTSVSAVVRRFLIEFASEETEFDRLKRQERELRAQIQQFRASDRLLRQNVHERRISGNQRGDRLSGHQYSALLDQP